MIKTIVLIVVLLSFFALGDVNSALPCAVDQDCQDQELGESSYCDESQICFIPVETAEVPPAEVPVTEEVPFTETAAPTDLDPTAVEALRTEVDSITLTLQEVQNRINQLTNDLDVLRSDTGLASEQLSSQANSMATGLAAVQDNLNQAQMNITQLKQSVEQEQNFSTLIKVVLFILVISGVAAGFYYYMNYQKKAPATGTVAGKEIVDYVVKHLKQGLKFSQVKDHLQRAGWAEEEIAAAYKEAVKLLQPAVKAVTATGGEKNKMIPIAVISLLVLIGIIFLLRGTTGKAVFYGQQIKEDTREVVATVQCTFPHILTPDGDACCPDLNNNTICDTAEREVEALSAAGTCTDNLQCSSDEYCVNKKCTALSSLYKGSPVCDKMCNYYTMNIKTSDGESYSVKPKQGSYTCVGALEWKIMEAPDHCKGEKAVVPIKIIKKAPGKILSEEVITLSRRQTSQTITHPTVKCSLTLTVEEIYELCN
ncbi:hypothetical protein HYX14_01105 [Candidatus Woesearchaeota archaeon]|nr:hypothetical protein [Candidatus Woesearchaeota archaeon]